LALFHKLAADTAFEKSAAAKLGEAEALRALDRTREAIEILESLIVSDAGTVTAKLRLADFYADEKQLKKCRALLKSIEPASAIDAKWKQYVEGRGLLAQDQAAPAL